MLLIPGIIGSAAPQVGDFESIATVTVGAGGAANVDFSNIPGTYQHLQIRTISRDNRASTSNSVLYRFNSVSTGSAYAYHILAGDGSSATASASTSQNETYGYVNTAASSTADRFAVAIIDILDYANTNKTKVIRTLGGNDQNGSGFIRLASGLWNSTNAITAIRLFPDNSASFVQYSHFALYGIKG